MVNVNWAFTKDAKHKAKENFEIYKKLLKKYRVACIWKYNEKDFDEYDLIYSVTHMYKSNEYNVIKNTTNLTSDQLALIFDGGLLSFGYKVKNPTLYQVYKD